jgi:hypothetical protein
LKQVSIFSVKPAIQLKAVILDDEADAVVDEAVVEEVAKKVIWHLAEPIGQLSQAALL